MARRGGCPAATDSLRFVASSLASKGELRGRERINGVPVIASFAELPMLLRQL